jgi:dCMP deaminase
MTDIDKYLAECDRIAYVNLCTHRDVGAVVVKGEEIVSVGRNTMPGFDACVLGGCPRGLLPPGQGQADYGDCVAVHAEQNAIIRAGLSMCRGSLLVVNSLPCHVCMRLARGAELNAVAYRWQGKTYWETLQ